MNSWPATVSLRWRSAGAVLVAIGHGLVVDGQDAVLRSTAGIPPMRVERLPISTIWLMNGKIAALA
jgi:hypothetical protein